MRILERVCTGELTGHRAAIAALTGAILTAVCAQIAFYLPGNPVPVSLQVFAVLLCGMALGSRLGFLSQLSYLAAGVAGLPVFAGFKGGWFVLAGPTGGYLVGFAVAALVVGWIVDRTPRAAFGARVLAGFTGVAVVYVLGRAWLALWMGDVTSLSAWLLGVAPFVGADSVEVLAAAAITSGRWNSSP